MLTLTSTLLDAPQQPSSRPFVKAVFSDYAGDRDRFRFQRVYVGSEGEYYSAIVGAPDGSLVRARIDPATKVLYSQRVASPGPGSTFSSWSSVATVSAAGAVALAANNTSVYLFYVDTDTLTVRVRTSSDNGASFGAATTVATAASAVTYLAAAIAPGGDRVLFWSVGAAVWKSRYSGGSWGAPASWSNSVASITGLAADYFLDWAVIVSGTATTSLDAKVWSCLYGDGANQGANTWSALAEVSSATAGSNVSFRSPALALLDHWCLFFVEKYTGSQAYSRLYQSTLNIEAMMTQELWREPAASDYPTTGTAQTTADYGVAASVHSLGGAFWLSAAAGVWLAPANANPDLEVSADVVEATVDLSERDGRVRLVLRNDAVAASEPAGRYAGYGAGALGAIRRGARLQLTPGYYTAAGPETPVPAGYWVESIEQTTGPQARLVIHARNAWWLLDQWRARRQFTWSAGTLAVSQLMQIVCARAGIDFGTAGASAALTALKPAFTIHPGESGKPAFLRLLAMVPDHAFAESARILVREPLAADAIEYAYGEGHAIVSARYRDFGPDTNRVRVLGAGVFNEGFDFGEIESMGERIEQVIDVNLTAAADAGARAGFGLRNAALRARLDEIEVFGVNCGQELYDVVAVTDPQANLNATKRRVFGLSWRYATGLTSRYEMTLVLGAP